MFRDFATDRVTLLKKNGRAIESLPASVQRGKIFVFKGAIDIEEGDSIERVMPGGRKERYVVEDPGFHNAFHGIPAHYQCVVRKDTGSQRPPSPPQEPAAVTTIYYNISGPQARVNVNSEDSSVNVVNTAPAELFAQMRQAVSAAADLNSELRTLLCERIDAMGQVNETRSFAKRYADFIAVAADHMQLFEPFLPALAQLLVKAAGG
jgi:hypothetical protein